jgi:hypothetical protein
MNNELEILCGKERWLLTELQVKYSDVYLQGQITTNPTISLAGLHCWICLVTPEHVSNHLITMLDCCKSKAVGE